MKYPFCLLVACMLALALGAQNTVRMDAVKATDYGVAYTLPKTVAEVTASYSKITKSAGEFYMYAERYLNISNPIAENSVEYRLDKLETSTIGVPNKENSFLVEFRPNSAMAFVTLTKDGMICAINDNYTFPKNIDTETIEAPKQVTINARQYFSEEILRAGSSAKQAELIAKQIYRLRESRTDILTGDSDNMPPDGDAYKLVMKHIDDQEQALTSLFVGTEQTETMTKTVSIEPKEKDIDNTIIARFSQKLGMVEANNLAGEPIYFSLKARTPYTPLELSEKDEKEREKKFSRGIIYNVPGKATMKATFKGKTFAEKDCDIVQFGTQDVLDSKQFGDRNSPLKVIFYPDLGAIKETGIAR